MKKIYYYNVLFIILVSIPSYSQIKGKVIDKLDNKPVSYANIIIKGKNFGTVSNEIGEFYLSDKQFEKNDTLVISHLNYETKYIFNFNENSDFELTQKAEELREIIITDKHRKIKEKTVGTKTESGKVILYFVSYSLGGEVGKRINVPKNTIFDLNNVSFMIYDFGFKKANLRVNFYRINNDYVDKQNCNTMENIIEINQSGLVTIDLSNQNLSFDSDFITSIELLNYEIDPNVPKEKRVIDFSSTVFSGPFYNRTNIHLKWDEIKEKFNIGLGINLSVEIYKND
ncbi:MAG: carboxypeptidase-like regulatory domain-containing protein [Lutibacter sp.]